jgi:hypothetical protein
MTGGRRTTLLQPCHYALSRTIVLHFSQLVVEPSRNSMPHAAANENLEDTSALANERVVDAASETSDQLKVDGSATTRIRNIHLQLSSSQG